MHYQYVQKESDRIYYDNAKMKKRLLEAKPFERHTRLYLDKEFKRNLTVERRQKLASPSG